MENLIKALDIAGAVTSSKGTASGNLVVVHIGQKVLNTRLETWTNTIDQNMFKWLSSSRDRMERSSWDLLMSFTNHLTHMA